MGNLIRFPLNRSTKKAKEEASYWLVSLDEGLSDSERTELEDWLNADRSHADTLVEMAQRWDEQNVLAELSEVFPLQDSVASRKRHSGSALGAICAAVIFVAVGLGFVLVTELRVGRMQTYEGATASPASHVGQGTYRTAVGEQLTIRLVDGSAVSMNTDSSVQVDYSESKRTIVLHHGEASFDVAKVANRPFEVHVGSHVLRAIGTVFNVRVGFENDIELVVNEGRVAVTAQSAVPGDERSADGPATPVTDATTELGASEIAIINDGSAVVRELDEREVEDKVAWKRGELVFRGEPLKTVIADIGRYTTTRFEIADKSIEDKPVGGFYQINQINDIDALLLALEESFGVDSTRVDENTVILRQQ